MDRPPNIAVIMPVLDEAAYLPAVLASLRAQTIDHARLYLIAVDNGSSDGSGRIVEEWLREGDIAGEVVRAEFRSIPRALNRALARAGDATIVRADAHTIYSPDYVTTVINAFKALPSNVWCVGGNPEPLALAGFGHALHAALFNNPMGLGPADYRTSTGVREVASVYLGAWRPGVLSRLGGFDTRWRANEDAELAERIRKAGGRVMRVPALSQKIMTRGAWGALAQWTRYGFWRAQTFKRHPLAIRLRHVVPPLAFLLALALLVSPARLALVPLGLLYAALTLALRPAGESPAVTAAAVVYFPLVHIGYACGLLTGSLIGTGRSPSPAGAGRAAPAP